MEFRKISRFILILNRDFSRFYKYKYKVHHNHQKSGDISDFTGVFTRIFTHFSIKSGINSGGTTFPVLRLLYFVKCGFLIGREAQVEVKFGEKSRSKA